MAFSDYHPCDLCGENKTFYDADMDVDYVDGHFRYDRSMPHYPGYRIYALCNSCEQTHQIVVVAKDSQ